MAWLGAADKYIVYDVHGVRYINLQITIAISRFKRHWLGSAQKNIVDQTNRVTDIDFIIGIGIAADIGGNTKPKAVGAAIIMDTHADLRSGVFFRDNA